MNVVTQLVARLLSALHQRIPFPYCHGDWLWTVALLGAIIGVLPVAAAIVMSLVRKFTGNRYGVGVGVVFAVVALMGGAVVPWSGFRAAAGLLSAGEVVGRGEHSCLVGAQSSYFTGSRIVFEAATSGSRGGAVLGVYLLALVGVPVLGLLCAGLLGRVTFRRGPNWPGRVFLWVPYVLLFLGTLGLPANPVVSLWAGFVPMLLFGSLVVFLLGAPSWSVIDRSEPRAADRHDRRAPYGPDPYGPDRHGPDRHGPDRYGPDPYGPDPYGPDPYGPDRYGPEPYGHPYPQTPPPRPQESHVPLPPPPTPPPQAPAMGLADTPGPLPFGPGASPGASPAAAVAPTGPTGPTQPVGPDGERFRRIRTLGKGGFGTVWLAMDNRLGRTVAVKFAHAPDTDTEQRVMREARALAAVHHPNCVRIYDVVTEQEGLGLVMEYIEGSSLSDTVREAGGIDDVAAARLWATMAGVLDQAHGQGVLHRDVKPSNVILDPKGSPHLIDFGIARSKGDMTLTQTGMMMGTPDFLAPETASGEGASPASDAWQLAATVSYALCGRPPRGVRDTPMAALMAAARAERLTELPQNSTHATLLAAALHADPQRRPSLAELRRELIRWLAARGYDEDGPVATSFTEPIADTTRRQDPTAARSPKSANSPKSTDSSGPRGR